MTNADFRPIFNAASFGAIAFFLSGTPSTHVEAREQYKVATPRYTAKVTSSSNNGSLVVVQAYDMQDFQKEVAAFYAEFAGRQTDMEPEIEQILLANMSSFYEN